MRNEFFANIEAGAAAVRSFACSSADRLARQLASDPAQESQNQLPCPEKPAEPTVRFSRQVLADFRSNVGRYAPKTRRWWTCATSIPSPATRRAPSTTMWIP